MSSTDNSNNNQAQGHVHGHVHGHHHHHHHHHNPQNDLSFSIEEVSNTPDRGIFPEDWIKDFRPPFAPFIGNRFSKFKKMMFYVRNGSILESMENVVESIERGVNESWHLPTIKNLQKNMNNLRIVFSNTKVHNKLIIEWLVSLVKQMQEPETDLIKVFITLMRIPMFQKVMTDFEDRSVIDEFNRLINHGITNQNVTPTAKLMNKFFYLCIFLDNFLKNGFSPPLNIKLDISLDPSILKIHKNLYSHIRRSDDSIHERNNTPLSELISQTTYIFKQNGTSISNDLSIYSIFILYKIKLQILNNIVKPMEALEARIRQVEETINESQKFKYIDLVYRVLDIYNSENKRFFNSIYDFGNVLLLPIRTLFLVGFAMRNTPIEYTGSIADVLSYHYSQNDIIFATVNSIITLQTICIIFSKVYRYFLDLVYVKVTGLPVEKFRTIQYVRIFIFYFLLRNLRIAAYTLTHEFFIFVFESALMDVLIRVDFYASTLKSHLSMVIRQL